MNGPGAFCLGCKQGKEKNSFRKKVQQREWKLSAYYFQLFDI